MQRSPKFEGWSDDHRGLGLEPACGFETLAEHMNAQVFAIWLRKRIALTDDPIVHGHYERSLEWLRKAQTAEQEGANSGRGGDRPSILPRTSPGPR